MFSRLNERVIFQRIQENDNGRGGVVYDYSNPEIIGEFWAGVKVKSRSNNELYQAKRLVNNVFITIRDNPDILPGIQAVVKGLKNPTIANMAILIDEITPAEQPGYIILAGREVVKNVTV